MAAARTAVALAALAVVVRFGTIFARLSSSTLATRIAGMLGLVTRAAHLTRRIVATAACLRHCHSAADTDGENCCDQDSCNR